MQLYVGCMTTGKTGIAIISIPEGKLMGKIPLPAKPQGIAVEQKGRRIYANMPTQKQVAMVDRDKRTLVGAWPLEDVEGNTPIGLDETGDRLFIGARQPARLVVLNTATGKRVAEVDTNSDANDLFYDPAHKRIYISCGEGFIDVIEQENDDRYKLLERVATLAGARTSTFSTQLSGYYLGVPRRGDQPAELRIFKVRPN